jgi:hypothetical protein
VQIFPYRIARHAEHLFKDNMIFGAQLRISIFIKIKTMAQLNGKGPNDDGSEKGRGLGKCVTAIELKLLLAQLGRGMGFRRRSGGGKGLGKRLKSGLNE